MQENGDACVVQSALIDSYSKNGLIMKMPGDYREDYERQILMDLRVWIFIAVVAVGVIMAVGVLGPVDIQNGFAFEPEKTFR